MSAAQIETIPATLLGFGSTDALENLLEEAETSPASSPRAS